MKSTYEISSITVTPGDNEPDKVVELRTADGRIHRIEGKLTNELVIHPDGGIYLKLFLRPGRTPKL